MVQSLTDLSITRIAGDGTLTEFGTPSATQPVNLEVDANDNLFSSSANPPANHVFRLTPTRQSLLATKIVSVRLSRLPDSTALALLAGKNGYVGDILFV